MINRYKISGLCIFIFVSLSAFSWDKRDSSGFVQPDRRISSSIELIEGQISYSYKTFKIRVSENVFKIEVKIDNSPTDLDIFMNYSEEIEDYDETDYSSTDDLFNEKLSLTRFSQNPLSSGVYYIDVVYPLEVLPFVEDHTISTIPFGLTVKYTILDNPQLLRENQAVHSSLSSRNSMMKLFAVDIHDDIESFRIDLFNTISDLDMYVSFEKPALSLEDADYIRESYLGQESLVINSSSVKPIQAGRYYISVFDRIEDSFTDEFSIITSFSGEAPGFLSEYPELPIPLNPLEKALYATVEITTETGAGSGCLVSGDGYIITGLHVITDISGEVSDEMFVSMNLSNFYPPRELFKAELIDIRKDEDLALLKISSGFYNQPLPENYTFPFYRLALESRVNMGQSLSFLGYPQIGSEGSRASISLTKGIVSGFDSLDFGYLIKTDGEINSGNSGGSAFNDNYELVGFPMSVISDDGGQIAYIHPVSLIPQEWLQKLKIKVHE